MKRKYLFFDIDGTLAIPGYPPSPAVVSAIRKVREEGHKVFISTGRAKHDVPEEIMKIGFDGGIYSAGGYIEADEKCIFEEAMKLEDIERIRQTLMQENLSYCMESPTGNFKGRNINSALEYDDLSWASSEIRRFLLINYIGDGGKSADQYKGEPVYKITYIAEDMNKVQRLKEVLDPYVKVVSFDNMQETGPMIAGEISDYSVNKGIALERICRYYGASLEDTIAFGDSLNDEEIIRAAGMGVAMGNSDQSILDIADLVCDSCENDGIAKALAQLL